MFIPTFNGQPSQPVPTGYSVAKDTEEASSAVLKGQTAESILQGTTAESILTKEGLMSPKKKDVTTVDQEKDTSVVDQAKAIEETNKQMDSLLQPDKRDENRLQSTEPPEVVTKTTIDHLTSQLKGQYLSIQKNSGYKYKNEKELDQIFSAQAAKLAVNGINDIRDIGYEDVTIDPTKRTIRNIQEQDGEYFYWDESSDDSRQVKIDPAAIQDLRKTEIDEGDAGITTRIEADILEGGGTERYLINKVTGKRLDYVKFTSDQFRKDLATKGEFSTSLAGSKGTLPLQDRGGFSRWGHQLDVDGQADYAAEFVDGNFITMPVWKDTKTDLTPIMMMGSIALMAAGVPGQIGGTLAPTGASAATKAAIGQAVVSGGITALAGGDFEDIAKAAVVSGGMSYVNAQIPQMSNSIGQSIFKAFGATDMTGAATLGTAITTAGVNGISAMILGQDVGKAMLAGAVTSAVQLNAGDFLKSTFGEDAFKNLAAATNLDEKQMENLVVRSISRGAGAMAYNRNFFTGFRDNLINEGLSLSAANAATKAMSEKMDKKQLAKVHRTVRKTASLALLAKQRGLNVSTVLQSAYPRLILDNIK